MTQPTTEAQALRARGVPIKLVDGSTVRLRYSMSSLEALEREHGNIGNILAAMRDAERSLLDSIAVADGTASAEQRERHAETERARRAGEGGLSLFGIIASAILPGLEDEQAAHPRTGAPFYLGDDRAAATKLLDGSQMRAYMEAFGQAFGEAFYGGDAPAAGGGAADPQRVAPELLTAPLPGGTGSTSVPSWAGGQTTSSGA